MDWTAIATSRLLLRRLTPEDVGERYVTWMNDAEVLRYLESRFRPHSAEDLRRYVAAQVRPDVLLLGVFTAADGAHIGNIKLDMAPYHRRGEIGIVIGDKAAWGLGFGSEAIGALTEHAFRALGLHKVTAGCYGNHAGSRRAFEKAGFGVEAVLKEHYRCDDEWIARIVLARFAPP